MLKRALYLSLILSLTVLLSCKKFVDVPVPEDRIVSADVFASDAKANEAMAAVYGNMVNGSTSLVHALSTIQGGLSSDELSKLTPTANEQEFLSNALTATNTTLKPLWTSAYQNIYYANAILEGVSSSDQITSGIRKQLSAECRFVRALHYFYLVNYFGAVPLVTTTDYATNSTLPRMNESDVYQLIITDLTEAKASLPEAYPSNEKIRPNKWAATALLARVYLYRRDYGNALANAGEVIGSGTYSLLPDPAAIFLKNSLEAIWQLSPSTGLLKETTMFRPTGTTSLAPQHFLTPNTIGAFESMDLRRKKWLDSVTYQGIRYYYPAKYRNSAATVTEYYTVLRFAEMYLVRAEARAQLGDLAGALQDLNVIRARAGVASVFVSTLNDFNNALIQERRREFMGEMGHRWLDLKRLGLATAVLGPVKPNWQATDELYPIPQDEIINNPYLIQNPGY